MSSKLLLVLALAATAAGGWWIGRHSQPPAASGVASSERKPLYYQSPMHPWIRSDQPGKCTICGMDLVPIYEAGGAADTKSKDVVILQAGSARAAGIATEPASVRPLVRTLRVAGMIDDDASRHRLLAATVKGRVEKLYVTYVGAEVEEGEPLAEFFSRELLGAIAEYQQTAPDSPLRTASAMKLRQMGLTERQIADLPKRDPKSLTVPIVAPAGGTVVAQNAYGGQWLSEGEKMFEIADFRKMWFRFDAYERDLPWLRLGQEVAVRTPSHPGRVFKSTITFIDPNLDEMTRTAKVRVELDNPLVEEGGRQRRTFLHRLFAEGEVQMAAPNVLSVPRAAVLWPGNRPRVFVDEGQGAFRLRRITLGREGDTHWEIKEGLKAGEAVVVRGGVLLDGQAQLLNNYEDPPAEDAPVAADECLVTGLKLGSMGPPVKFRYQDREVQFCCDGCESTFLDHPARWLARLPKSAAASGARP